MEIINPEEMEMLPCQHCGVDFSPDCAETFNSRLHFKLYKCPHCGEMNG